MNLILHIGVSKTGSTSIQRSLHANSGVLDDFYIPNSADLPFIDKGHHKGVAYLANAKRLWGYMNGYLMLEQMFKECDSILAEAVEEKNITKYRELYIGELKKLIEKAKSQNCKAVLMSTELLSEVYSSEDVFEFCQLLDPLFDRKQIVVYLRDQLYAYISLYAQNLKGGAKFSFDEFVKVSGAKIAYDYDSLIKKWSDCGWEVVPRVFYEKHDAPTDWSIINDFELAISDKPRGFLRKNAGRGNNRHNVSPNADTLCLIRFFNRLGLAGKMIRIQQLALRSAKILMNGNDRFLRRYRKQMQQVVANHEPGNTAIAKRFFNRKKLFK